MTTKRILLPMMGAALVLALSSCADESGDADLTASTATGSTSQEVSEGAEPAHTTDAQETQAEPASAVPADWAEQLIAAFVTYDEGRQAADRVVGERMSPENQKGLSDDEMEAMFNDALAEQMDIWADAAEELLDALPEAVPSDVEPAFNAILDARIALVAGLREAGAGLRAGDGAAYDRRVEPIMAFELACATLQNAVRDLDEGLLGCGIPGEDPEVPPFEDGPTIDETNEDEPADFVDMPAGSYALEYVGPEGIRDIFVELAYETDLLIRSSRQLVELAIPDEGPTTRVHASELIANPFDLRTEEVRDNWLLDGPVLAGDPTGWIERLEGVSVVATGEGEIGGTAARFWDLVSELDAPIAVLGDGPGLLPDTTLEPGRPVRLWSVHLPEQTVLITQHVPTGSELSDHAAELETLLSGLSLSAR